MGVLSDIWQMAADRVGKIRVIEDPKVCLFPICYFKGFYPPNRTSWGVFSSDWIVLSDKFDEIRFCSCEECSAFNILRNPQIIRLSMHIVGCWLDRLMGQSLTCLRKLLKSCSRSQLLQGMLLIYQRRYDTWELAFVLSFRGLGPYNSPWETEVFHGILTYLPFDQD